MRRYENPPVKWCCNRFDSRQIIRMKTPKLLLVTLAFITTFANLQALAQSYAPVKVTHVQAKEAAKLVEKGGVTVLDLRTQKEFTTSHIPGATNIDCQADNFAAQLEKLDREKPYLIHCGAGRRSTNSLPQFEKLGFKHVIHLDGGLKGWEAAKQPVTKDSPDNAAKGRDQAR